MNRVNNLFSMKHKALWVSVGVAVFLIAVLGYVNYKGGAEKVLGKEDYELNNHSSDVVGTHIATSTEGYGFRVTATGGKSATSSYVSKIGSNKEQAIYTIKITNVSSTALLSWDITGSTDDYCDSTSSTPTSADLVSSNDINWFDVGNHIPYRTQLANYSSVATSTSAVGGTLNPTKGVGHEILLVNLDFECLKLNVAGSSTEAYIGLTTK